MTDLAATAALPKPKRDFLPVLLPVILALAMLPLIRSGSSWVTLTVASFAMGMMIFIMASGLTLVFGLMDVLNFGHGAFISVGAYVATLVLLPLGEIVLRKLFQTGISGATAFQQHLTLFIGLLGGALAARERRLLTLSTVVDLLKGQWQVFSRVFSSAFAAGISVFLCVAAVQLVQMEKEAGELLAQAIPLWTLQLVMPLSFGVIALRLLWHAAESWRGWLVALLLAGGVVWAGLRPPIAPDALVLPALLLLLLAVVLGAPIFVLLGGAALSAAAATATAQPAGLAVVHTGVGAQRCPVCAAALQPLSYEGATVLACRTCGGRLVGETEVGRIIARREMGFTAGQERIADQVFAQGNLLRRMVQQQRAAFLANLVTCPTCGRTMTRRHYNYAYAVAVDVCEICGVFWFDKDELEVLQILIERQIG